METLQQEKTSDIQIGNTVRSFDFSFRDVEGNNACYVEGTVEGIGRFYDWNTCNVYKIKCTKRVFGGKVIEDHEDYYFPPKNGTPSILGPTDNVELI